MRQTTLLPALMTFILLWTLLLACAGTPDNLRVTALPQYICPSATPRLTDTPRPTSPPQFPFTFQANLDYGYVDVGRSLVRVQYLAQSTGLVQLHYWGVTHTGAPWYGSGGALTIAYAPMGMLGVISSYPIFIPPQVVTATIQVTGGYTFTFTVPRYYTTLFTQPQPIPCCLPAPIYPTPVPTYTPYPTPTPYVRTSDYFLGDPVYVLSGTQRLRFKVTEITTLPTTTLDHRGNPQNVSVWRLEVKNIGGIEYNLFPAAQMYVSEVVTPMGGTIQGVWGASLAAAAEAGITPDYDPAALLPGETRTFSLAAFAPLGTVYRLSFALDLTGRGTQTQVPGAHIVSWLNAVNTDCRGEIQEP